MKLMDIERASELKKERRTLETKQYRILGYGLVISIDGENQPPHFVAALRPKVDAELARLIGEIDDELRSIGVEV